MKTYQSRFRPEIDALAGYQPGEQPRMTNLVKLNTNENPYPPSPRVAEALRDFDSASLRRYSDPDSTALRTAIAERWGVGPERVIAGNGSDDILTMVFRGFTAPDRPFACPDPTYSLYPVLAAMQGAPVIRVPLDRPGFTLPADFADRVRGANLVALARPNAPTGNTFPIAAMRDLCERFAGAVLIDEAYADFADDDCAALLADYPNLIISRTFSKSYSLAGMRLGYAVSSPEIITGLFKLKDSYNLDAVTQAVGLAAYQDQAYLRENVRRIRAERERVAGALAELGFEVNPSAANFLFAAPPDRNGEAYFRYLRNAAVIVRYFPGAVTGDYVRITIGKPDDMDRLLELTRTYLATLS